jgi:hypothetical protein
MMANMPHSDLKNKFDIVFELMVLETKDVKLTEHNEYLCIINEKNECDKITTLTQGFPIKFGIDYKCDKITTLAQYLPINIGINYKEKYFLLEGL